MSILIKHQQHTDKVRLYQVATAPQLPQPQLFSFMRIAGQLSAEQTALNTQILSQFQNLEAANDPEV